MWLSYKFRPKIFGQTLRQIDITLKIFAQTVWQINFVKKYLPKIFNKSVFSLRNIFQNVFGPKIFDQYIRKILFICFYETLVFRTNSKLLLVN
jgi:hypothetical protein